MSKFALFVTANPFNGQGHLSALGFARAAIRAGHHIDNVFFSSDAVLVAHRYLEPASDEPNPQRDWMQMASEHGVELLLCSSACQKRGLLDENSAKAFCTQSNIASPFVIAGLGSLVESALIHDRLIQFPG